MLITKPIATAAIATGLTKYMFKSNFNYAASFGASVGTGVLVADLLSTKLHGNEVSRSIEKRALEVGLGVGAGLGIHKYIMGNEFYNLRERVGVAVASEIAGEWLCSSFHGV